MLKGPKQMAIAAITLMTVLSLSDSTRSQSMAQNGTSVEETQVRGVWVDPSTHLMWAGKDNGKDVSWRSAMKYCHALRLDRYSDWRLANMAELQGIYDKGVEAPGLAGPSRPPRAFTWHVKGNLFLTGDQWSGHQVTGRMPLESYEYHFDFNEGRADKDPSGWPYPSSGMRALCVRGPER
jgi:hypothetical protein